MFFTFEGNGIKCIKTTRTYEDPEETWLKKKKKSNFTFTFIYFHTLTANFILTTFDILVFLFETKEKKSFGVFNVKHLYFTSRLQLSLIGSAVGPYSPINQYARNPWLESHKS